ncbi:hypothetical protein B0H16DRAFT_1834838 [Mycena metata]|uniref:G domain-containing protein n=1 Tax=Mycena metata TaxID=1033252 RepID=A0AAD7IZH1_9AGAR|nr:hypothetical protein B0H16DRAFT_1834838 [Mycena metata]
MGVLILSPFRNGALGQTVDEALDRLGTCMDTQVQRLATNRGMGPSPVAEKIISSFGIGEQRVLNLIATQTRLRIQKDSDKEQTVSTKNLEVPPKLERRCSKLVKYTLPKEALQTQCRAFQRIVQLTTLFPGLRLLFIRSDHIQSFISSQIDLAETLSRFWDRPDGPVNAEWNFWRSFAKLCLSDTSISNVIEECPVRQLTTTFERSGRICVIEALLDTYNRCEDARDILAALSIRYMGEIVASKEFWAHIQTSDSQAMNAILNKLCLMMFNSLQDLEPAPAVIELPPFDYEGVDVIGRHTLVPILDRVKELDTTPHGEFWEASNSSLQPDIETASDNLLNNVQEGASHLAIVVEGQKLATSINPLQAAYAARNGKSGQRDIKVITGYGNRVRFLSPHVGQDSLLETERSVNEEIKNLHGTSSNVAAIFFLCSARHADSTAYPFKLDTSFLGLSGSTLLKRLTVVPPVPGDDWGRDLQDLVDAGMCILSFKSQSDVLLPRVLARISQGMDVVQGEIGEIYRRVAIKNKRNEGQAVILLVGGTLHGKSKTINRLLGRELLPVMIGAVGGSTTKDIERVKVYNTTPDTATTVTVAFDDTPGFDSTRREDRTLTETLMKTYKQEYFAGTYTNVILLVVTWDSILPNADHESPHIRSVVGRLMESLSQSGLVDNARVNVVVVVTKSLSSLHEFDHFKSPKDRNSAWMDEANKRRAITARLQSKILPNSVAWETVLIENGGGKDMTAKFPKLPDGNLSHENLYHAIRRMVESPEPYGIGDLAGIQALQVLAGAQPLGPSFRTDRQFLLTPS